MITLAVGWVQVRRIKGGQLHMLNISQDYGTYRVVADNDPTLSVVKFEVCNRAQDKFWLNRMSSLRAENVQIEKLGVKTWMVDLTLTSETSGTPGEPIHHCRSC
eukprot:9112600-Pyramimonas_sp.AAC.1